MAKNAPNGKLYPSLVVVTWQTMHLMSVREYCTLEFCPAYYLCQNLAIDTHLCFSQILVPSGLLF